jgi:tRNA (adenine57-N1/adenine58-N1)-methyltransferase
MSAESGTSVILFGNFENVFLVQLCSGQIFNCRYGSFPHDSIISQLYGSQIFNNKGDGFVYLLAPTPPLLTAALQHRTQIIYDGDISVILAGLGVREGLTICEAGTGSGSLSVAFSAAIGSGGRLFTFEFNTERKLAIDRLFESLRIGNISTAERDVISDGFPDEIQADCVFLDLPSPWLCIDHVMKTLKPLGRVCLFSPCIEQVTRNCEALAKRNFQDIETYEVLLKPWGLRQAIDRKRKSENAEISDKFVSFQLPMRGHTAYLTFARKSLEDEHLQPKTVVSVDAVLKTRSSFQ